MFQLDQGSRLPASYGEARRAGAGVRKIPGSKTNLNIANFQQES